MLVVFVSALPWATGCAGKQPPTPVPVSGSVVNERNEPVSEVLLTFWAQGPRDPQQPESYRVPVGKDGTFSFQCPEGVYRVTLAPIPVRGSAGGLSSGPGPGATPLKDIAGKYQDREKTALRIDVPEGGTDKLVLRVK
jgi:hypothetical protein